MRKNILLITFSILTFSVLSQNVGIGTPNPLNKLHIAGGLRLDTLIGINGNGLLTHNPNGVVYGLKFTGSTTDVLRGDGTFGTAPAGQLGWFLTGNAGINPSTQFIGTTDAQPLNFRVNNFPAGQIHHSTENTAFGLYSLSSNTTGTANSFFWKCCRLYKHYWFREFFFWHCSWMAE